MKKIEIVLAMAALAANAGEPYSQVHRIFAAWPEKIEPAVKANPGAFRDGIIVAAFPKELKPGPEFVKEFANQIDGKRQIGVAVPPLPDGEYPQGPIKRFGDLYQPGDLSWRKLIYIGVPLTFRREHAACELPKGMNPGVLDFAECEKIKDELDRRCGGRMPLRVDSILRFGQSVWENPDGSERIVFLWNFDYDDAEDVRLVEDKPFAAEEMVCPVKGNGETGPIAWRPLGRGDMFTVARVPALSVRTIRLLK